MDADEQSGRKKAKLTLEDVFGSVKPLRPGADIDDLIRIAKDERAADFVKKLRAE